MKFNENLSKGSGDMEQTRKGYGWNDRLTDGWTDKGHSYKSLSDLPQGINYLLS